MNTGKFSSIDTVNVWYCSMYSCICTIHMHVINPYISYPVFAVSIPQHACIYTVQYFKEASQTTKRALDQNWIFRRKMNKNITFTSLVHVRTCVQMFGQSFSLVRATRGRASHGVGQTEFKPNPHNVASPPFRPTSRVPRTSSERDVILQITLTSLKSAYVIAIGQLDNILRPVCVRVT